MYTWRYTTYIVQYVYISSVQPPTKDAQDISRKHYVLLKMTSLTGLSKSDRHTDHTVLTCANQYYTWPKIVVHRQLGLHGLLDCSSKCPRVLLVLSVPIRPLIAKSSSQDTASNNCILSLWLPGKDSSILIMSFLSLFHSVMESCIEVQKNACIESKSASPYPSSYSSAFLPASWTALEKKLRTLHRTSWTKFKKKLKATKGDAQIEAACTWNQSLVWSTDNFTSMLTLFSRSFIVIHVGCDFCGSCEVRVARPLAKSCVSGGPSWCFLGNARPGPVKRAANLSLVLARSELQFHHQLDMHCWTCCIKSHWLLLHSGFSWVPRHGLQPQGVLKSPRNLGGSWRSGKEIGVEKRTSRVKKFSRTDYSRTLRTMFLMFLTCRATHRSYSIEI